MVMPGSLTSRISMKSAMLARFPSSSVSSPSIFSRDGRTIVYRRADGGYEPQPVILGPESGNHAVVASGLQPGDRVALQDPTLGAGGAAAVGPAASETAP